MRQLVYVSAASRELYVSAASRELNDRDLEQILDASRRNNPKHDVTGMPLVIDLGFLQILEGPRQSVEHVLARISQDERHKSIKVLVDEDVDERLSGYGAWASTSPPLPPPRRRTYLRSRAMRSRTHCHQGKLSCSRL